MNQKKISNRNNLTKFTIAILVVLSLIQVNVSRKKVDQLKEIKENVNTLQSSLETKEDEIKKVTFEKNQVIDDVTKEREKLENEFNDLRDKTENLSKKLTTKQNNISRLTKEIIEDTSKDTVLSIKNKNISNIRKIIHPVKGLRISPDSFIATNHKVIHNKDIKSLFNDKEKYSWGISDGAGNDIKFTFSEYYNKFIYSVDFAIQSEINYGKDITRTDKPNNVFEFYSDNIIVEYFYPGTKVNNNMDWKSLRLVFEEYEDKWYLVGLIHSQY